MTNHTGLSGIAAGIAGLFGALGVAMFNRNDLRDMYGCYGFCAIFVGAAFWVWVSSQSAKNVWHFCGLALAFVFALGFGGLVVREHLRVSQSVITSPLAGAPLTPLVVDDHSSVPAPIISQAPADAQRSALEANTGGIIDAPNFQECRPGGTFARAETGGKIFAANSKMNCPANPLSASEKK